MIDTFIYKKQLGKILVRILADVIYQNKLQQTHIPHLRHSKATRVGKC
jgi:hypothetical protein